MPLEVLKGEKREKVRKRITQRDLIPKAVKLRNSEIYQLGEQTIIIYDKDNETVLSINQVDNRLEFGSSGSYYVDYLTGNAVFKDITASSIDSPENVKEYWLQVSPQWQFALNRDVFFEVTAKTDAGTGTYQLYNITDAAAFAGSELSTASTDPIILRSGTLTIPTGSKEVKVQYKCVGGDGATEYVNCIVAKLIVRTP